MRYLTLTKKILTANTDGNGAGDSCQFILLPV